ncbi:acetate--CoA ligase family protein [Desulforhopalus singaporensis]|uniref:Acetyltransferase n=1 Tax=Desulforhopalus singaporensis TaxID=91360 RepID=A0A1H0SBZ9_9BACT|nr:acetate--CoA ligase family protein [Desulforhopalus singaporensis]SDP39283.1 acetyltransferase [Desulforhopalus singaporensis]
MDIGKLLAPGTVAIVGASEKEGFGGDTCRNVISYGNTDKVYYVNPKRDTLFGKKCFSTLSDIPGPVDLVVLCTPQKLVEPLLKEAAAKGVGGAVVYASGYSETGTAEGKKAEEDLKGLCTELDIALMGPNCAGYMNYVDQVAAFAFISAKRDRKGSVGLISQSGQLCLSFMDHPAMRFSYCISAGNCSVVTMEDYFQYLIDDVHTKVIGLYLEGVTHPEKFTDALRSAAQKRKPVVILKAGRSEKGSRVAASHTGSLSGADAIYDAIFKKFGVIRANDAEELLATTQLFATMRAIPEKTGLASINLSGGETGICADMGEMAGLDYPDFNDKTLARLKELLPSYASPANPLDTTATISYDADTYAEVLQTVMDDPKVGMVVIGYTLLHEIADPCIHYMAQGIEKVVQNNRSKPMAMLPFFENSRNPEYEARLAAAGVPVLPPPAYGFAALRHLMDFVAYSPEEHTLELAIPSAAVKKGRRTLSEQQSAAILRDYNIPTPEGNVGKTADDAVKIAGTVGYPVVMKIASADIAHKSDIGGVELQLTDETAVRKAFDRIMSNGATHAPQAAIDGVLVQRMLSPGLEVIIGVNNDPQFGPAVLVGLGGVFVEIFKDTVLIPAPFSKEEALRMLSGLKALPLFQGYRGKAELDIDALADAVANVSRLAAEQRDVIAELDINPVFVYEKGQGVCSADALVVTSD